MDFRYTTVDTPLGAYLLVASPRGLSFLERVQGDVHRTLRHILPADATVRAVDRLPPFDAQLREYFEGRRRDFDGPLDPLGGTAFQRKVWKALGKIPYGETRSYRWLAQKVGNRRAVRAVGQANGRNPIAIVVPCHRVVNSDGGLGGYTGGLGVKRRLLEHEGWLPTARR